MRPDGKRDWNVEPAIDELLADPVTRAVMARDGVIAGELLALLRTAGRRVAADGAAVRSGNRSD